MKQIIVIALFFISMRAAAQMNGCNTMGQSPLNAYPICGTTTFSQGAVPFCGGEQLPSLCPTGQATDINPFWYKFTCYQSGTLGFSIVPNSPTDNYDWQLFDITGKIPTDVYTQSSLFIACNWSEKAGTTGTSTSGNELSVCSGLNKPPISKMPDIIAGREYLLLVSHSIGMQSGYNLSFAGGDAVITDTTTPKMVSANAGCGSVVLVKLNKKIKCSSIAYNGSDFTVTPGINTVINATGYGCNKGFDTDSLIVQVTQGLLPGNYILTLKKGTDNNTVLDYCDNDILENSTIPFNVFETDATPVDSMMNPSCKMQSIKLVFSKPLLCNSISANGSDFILTGTYGVFITGVETNCNNGVTKEVIVNLNKPLNLQGSFTISVKPGSDGNVLINECGFQTSPGSSLNFNVMDTVDATFTYSLNYGCTADTVFYFHPGDNGINQWRWILDENKTSSQQNPRAIYNVFNRKKIQLAVSNGFCSDSSITFVDLDHSLEADYFVSPNICPGDSVIFASKAQGKIAAHRWTFGDGSTSDLASPSHIYLAPPIKTMYNVIYTVRDSIGCEKSISKPVTVYTSCVIAVPGGFTPNGDNKNDLFYPLNAVKADNLKFLVYNRYGQLIFQTSDWLKGWDGTFKGIQQQPGVYVWFLQYTNRDTGEVVQQKGTVVLIR